jgi:hypothetical protein
VAVVVLLLAAIPAALFGRWIFWVGVAIFAVIGIADFFMRDQPLD